MSLLDVSPETARQRIEIEVNRIPGSIFGNWEATTMVSMHPHHPLHLRAVEAGQNEAFDTLRTHLRCLGFIGDIELYQKEAAV